MSTSTVKTKKSWETNGISYSLRGESEIIYATKPDATKPISTRTKDRGEAEGIAEMWWGLRENRTFGDAFDACKDDLMDMPSFASRSSHFDWLKHNTDIWEKQFTDINREYVMAVVKDKQQTSGTNPRTLNNYISTISTVMTRATEDKGFKYPGGLPKYRFFKESEMEEKEAIILTPQQEDDLYSVLPSEYRDAVGLAMYTGIRKEEMFGLTWGKIDLEKHTVKVKNKNKNKAKNSMLTLTLIPDAVKHLKKMKRRSTTSALFPSKKPIPHQKWKDYLLEAGLPEETRWHDLRHTFATRLVNSGVNPMILKELMGHTKVSMSERYYKAENSAIKASLVGISIA